MNYSFVESSVGKHASAEAMYNMLSKEQLNPWKFTPDKNATQINVNEKFEYDGIVKVSGTNMLGLIMFSIVFGAFLGQMGESGQLMVTFFKILLEIIMNMVTLIIW